MKMSFIEYIPTMFYTTLTGVLLYNIFPVSNYILNLILYKPGVGALTYRKKKGVFVETNLGKIKLPFYKLPSTETDVYFFHQDTVVEKNELLTRESFDKIFSNCDCDCLKHYNMGLITDVIRPKDYKGKEKICGYISSLFEDYVYVFTFENNEFIDYEKLFEMYHDALQEENETMEVEVVDTNTVD